jgi:hypothetical protein
MAASSRSDSASRSSSNSDAYTDNVIAADWWPSIRCTCLTVAPDATASEAAVWRRSCGVSSPNPVEATAGSQTRRCQFLGRNVHPPASRTAGLEGPSRPSLRPAGRQDTGGSAHRGSDGSLLAMFRRCSRARTSHRNPWRLARTRRTNHHRTRHPYPRFRSRGSDQKGWATLSEVQTAATTGSDDPQAVKLTTLADIHPGIDPLLCSRRDEALMLMHRISYGVTLRRRIYATKGWAVRARCGAPDHRSDYPPRQSACERWRRHPSRRLLPM